MDPLGDPTGVKMRHDVDSQGLALDLAQMNPHRRQLLVWLGAAASLGFAACAGGKDTGSGVETGLGGEGSEGTDSQDTSADSCQTLPEETAGPYPGDGSNGPNILTLSDVVRSDIRTSVGEMGGTAAGVLLTLRLKVVRVSEGCAPLAGYAIYLWHANRDGLYSLYTLPTENYLRGVQVTDGAGEVTFVTIFPGCYDGRWPHIHFEVYEALDATDSAGNALLTSQLALPASVCAEAYTVAGYEASVTHLSQTTLDTHMVFADGHEAQVAAVTGDAEAGYTATLTIGLA